MKHILSLIVLVGLAMSLHAAWYWPFGSDEDESDVPRLSQLLEEASEIIDQAMDYAADGKIDEAVAEYRKALEELDRVERENPERAATPEFASLRNKRAYVSAAIDSMLLEQAHRNAKAVAVTDTTELEAKMAARASAGKPASETVSTNAPALPTAKPAVPQSAEVRKLRQLVIDHPTDSALRLQLAGAYVRDENYEQARAALQFLLDKDPTDLSALCLLGVCEAQAGNDKAARTAFDRAIVAHPTDYCAFYNMAKMILRTNGDVEEARRYYDTGRRIGGPKDDLLEEAFK